MTIGVTVAQFLRPDLSALPNCKAATSPKTSINISDYCLTFPFLLELFCEQLSIFLIHKDANVSLYCFC